MVQPVTRDRDTHGRPRNARRRDRLGRPLPRDGDEQPPVGDAGSLPPAAALRLAQDLLDADRAFEAHEALEAVWKATSGDERELWRGLAQLAVGVTHHARGNPRGAAQLLDRGAASLRAYAGTTPHGVAVDRLRAWAVDAATSESVTRRPLATMPRLVGQAADERA